MTYLDITTSEMKLLQKKRSNANNAPTSHYPKNHDVILFYTKTKKYTFNSQYLKLSASSILKYNKIDENGDAYVLVGLLKRGYNKLKTLTFKGCEYMGGIFMVSKNT